MSEIAPPEARGSVAGFQEGVMGVTPPIDPGRRGSFLSDVIIELGFADEAVVERAVQAARQPGRNVGELLIKDGVIDAEQLARATAERSGLDYVDLDDFEVDFGATGLISRSAAERYGAVPIAFASDGALIVVLEDPADALAISDIEVMTKSDVRRAVASPRAIAELLERIPGGGRKPASAKPDPVEVEPEPGEEAPRATPVEAPADVVLNEVPESEEPEVERLRAELAEAEDEQERLRVRLAEAEDEHERLRLQLAETEADAYRAREEVAKAISGRDLLRKEAMRLAKELKRLESPEG